MILRRKKGFKKDAKLQKKRQNKIKKKIILRQKNKEKNLR